MWTLIAPVCFQSQAPHYGTLAIPPFAARVHVDVIASNADYQIIGLETNWNTTRWIEPGSQTSMGFQVNFGTPAPGDGSGLLDWGIAGG